MEVILHVSLIDLMCARGSVDILDLVFNRTFNSVSPSVLAREE